MFNKIQYLQGCDVMSFLFSGLTPKGYSDQTHSALSVSKSPKDLNMNNLR